MDGGLQPTPHLLIPLFVERRQRRRLEVQIRFLNWRHCRVIDFRTPGDVLCFSVKTVEKSITDKLYGTPMRIDFDGLTRPGKNGAREKSMEHGQSEADSMRQGRRAHWKKICQGGPKTTGKLASRGLAF